MTIQTIGSAGVAIFIDEEELRAVGASAGELDLDSAKPIVSTALIEAGVNTEGVMEIEAFQNGGSLLIFARMLETEPVFFVFDEFETLICAAKALPKIHGDSSLTYLDGAYYLTLPPGEHEAIAVLCEFAEKRELPPKFMLHLREHGKTVCEHAAVSRLLEYFD